MKLKGECNLCGICCFSHDGSLHCANLSVTLFAGAPNGTQCMVYAQRYDGMPIKMIDREGVEHHPGLHVCSKDSDMETRAIIEKGISKGLCSLEIA
jgi:hypothetical protein